MRLALVASWGLIVACAACSKNAPITPVGFEGGRAGAAGSTSGGAGSPGGAAATAGAAGAGGATGTGGTSASPAGATGAAGESGVGGMGMGGMGVGGAFVACPGEAPATSLFLAPASIAYPSDQWPEGLALGDLNGDGVDDLVVGGSMATPPGTGGAGGAGVTSLEVVLADQAKLFAPGVRYDGGVEPYFLEIADLNGDKLPDVVSAAFAGPAMFLNAGAGALAAPTSYPLTVNATYRDLATADFDGDGRSEVIFAADSAGDASNAGVIVLKSSDGSGYTAQNLDEGFNARALAVGDVDGRGGVDLVAAGTVPERASTPCMSSSTTAPVA